MTSRKKSVLRQNQLYESTSIEGFGLINESETKNESIFWYMVIIAFMILTIYHVFQTVTNYLSDPIKTEVSLSSSENDELPSFFFVLGISLLEFSPLPEAIPKSELEMNSFVQDLSYQVLYQQNNLSKRVESKKLLHYWYNDYAKKIENCTAEFSNSTDCHYYKYWMDTVDFVPVTSQLLLHILLNLYPLQMEPIDFDSNHFFLYPINIKENQFVHSAAELGISTKQMLDKVSKDLTDLFKIELQGTSNISGEIMLQGIQVIANQDQMPFLELKFHNRFPQNARVKGVKISLESAIKRSILNRGESMFYNSFFHSYFSKYFFAYFMDGQDAIHAWQSNVPLANDKRATTFTYVITGKRITFTNKSCLLGTRPNFCYEECKNKAYVKLCDCSPWNLFMVNSVNPASLCNARNCIDEYTLADEKSNCLKSCEEHNYCQTNLYRIDFNEQHWKENEHERLNIQVKIKQTAYYPVFEIHYEMTFAEFLGELGGQMGAWIGITFMSLLHLCAFYGKRYLKKKENEDNIDPLKVTPEAKPQTQNTSKRNGHRTVTWTDLRYF